MSDKLKQLQAATDEQPFFTYLYYIGQGMEQVPSINLKRMVYQSNQITVDLSAANSADFSSFINFLTQQNLSVKQQNANFTGSEINATLLIE